MRNPILLLILRLMALLILLDSKVFALNSDVGQILMVGFNEASVNPELIAHLKKIKPGAIILFRRNIKNPNQLHRLIKTLESELNPVLSSPLIFALDQEGGSVFRIPTNPKVPSAAALGKNGNFKIVEHYGAAIGKMLRRNGITMNLAPVLDLEVEDNFIGSRSFGTDPLKVAQLGYLFSKGLASAGVIPTGKHFPGLGSVIIDPHEKTPTSDLEWNQDWNRELLPFRAFSHLSPSALMLSHVIYPRLDNQKLPASVSPFIIRRVLRETLKYEGLIITDDLLMKGLTTKYSPSQAALASLKAGADFVMLSWSKEDQSLVYKNLNSSLLNGELDKKDLENKSNRIAKIKSLIGIGRSDFTQPMGWGSPEIRDLNKELLSINLSMDKKNYRKISDQNNIYCINLGPVWLDELKLKFPQKKITSLNRYEDFRSLEENKKENSTSLGQGRQARHWPQ